MGITYTDKSENVNKTYGVNYEKKLNSYIIKYEECSEGKKYDANVFPGFIEDIAVYNTSGHAYDIGYSKLIDLVNKHATIRPPSMSIPLNEKQYVLSYINERLPESFYYREHLIEWVSAFHELSEDKEKEWDSYNDVNNKIDKCPKKLQYYLQSVSVHLYGCRDDRYEDDRYFYVYNYSHTKYANSLYFKCTYYSINAWLCRIVDDIVKYLQGDSDTTFSSHTFVNKYK